jgi:hypothetical protein
MCDEVRAHPERTRKRAGQTRLSGAARVGRRVLRLAAAGHRAPCPSFPRSSHVLLGLARKTWEYPTFPRHHHTANRAPEPVTSLSRCRYPTPPPNLSGVQMYLVKRRTGTMIRLIFPLLPLLLSPFRCTGARPRSASFTFSRHRVRLFLAAEACRLGSLAGIRCPRAHGKPPSIRNASEPREALSGQRFIVSSANLLWS